MIIDQARQVDKYTIYLRSGNNSVIPARSWMNNTPHLLRVYRWGPTPHPGSSNCWSRASNAAFSWPTPPTDLQLHAWRSDDRAVTAIITPMTSGPNWMSWHVDDELSSWNCQRWPLTDWILSFKARDHTVFDWLAEMVDR